VATVRADLVATGIPGAGAITEVGTFLRGGPFIERVALAAQAHPVLDGTRLLVASTSNFGAALAFPQQPEGSILSIDVSAARVDVTDPAFAATVSLANRHPGTANGAVLLYTAQNSTFTNSINGNTAAVTASLPAVSLPLGISLNNGFGRPWFANAPDGSDGSGTITVIDPNGAPLAGAPSPVAGGVFAGSLTNRTPSSTGLTAAAMATALVTKSPDGSGRAVFLAGLADGSVAQVHVQRGVDGLAPPGSFTPIANITRERVESNDPTVVTRVGLLFNWVPTRTVFVTDPLADRILAFDLADDGMVFQAVNVRYLKSPALHTPVDLAPAAREAAARNFASNTTLGGGSDFYVLNRATNSIVRMTQSGEVVAVRQITSDIEGFRLNGLCVSEDARTLWLTATAPGGQGVVLRTPTFGAGATTTSLLNHALSAGATGLAGAGADIFSLDITPSDGLGPLFNGQSCVSCHNTPATAGMGVDAQSFVTRVAKVAIGRFDPMPGHGGPIARQRSIAEFGHGCGLPTGIPPSADATSVRSAMSLRGTALIDSIVESDIVAAQAAEPAAVRGRMNILPDGRAGRFGWKAQTATLVEFMGEAFRDEIGLTNPLGPRDLVNGCGASTRLEADAVPLTSLVAFLNTVDPPEPSAATLTSPGAAVFASTGCAACHKPSYRVLGSTANASGAILTAFLYSDLLLHDMGEDLADGFVQGSATGSEFRTAPLWRVSERQHFLHDGRAKTILDAILAHGGQASGAVAAFKALSAADRQALLDFLNGI